MQKNNKENKKKYIDETSLNEEHQSIVKTYESLMKSYQRWILVMFYPSLFSAIAACFAFKSTKIGPSFLMGHQLLLRNYFLVNPLGGNNANQQNIFGYLIVLGVAIAFSLINGYLISLGYRQKKYSLIIMTSLYAIDFVISCLDIVLEPKNVFNLGNYIGNVIIHIIFLLLFIVPFIKYGKLSSFNKKIKGE